MAEPNAASGSPAPGQPAGNGAAPNAPSIDIDALVSKVAESLKPVLSQEITGAVKRNVASALEGIDLAKLKGEPPAPNGGEPGKKLTKAEVEAAELRQQVERLTKESDRNRTRALRGGVIEAVGKAGVTDEAAELLVDKFAALVIEDESGKLHVKTGDDSQPFEAFLGAYLKDRKGLLKSTARPGSGAGAASTWSEPMPKTRTELLFHPKDKGPDGKPLPTPNRANDFKRIHGEAAWKALPL